MKTGVVVGLGILATVVLTGMVLVVSAIGFYNTSIRMENGIKAQYEQNKNNYDNYFKKLKEVAQVPDMYVADMKKLWDGVMAGRYGAKGSQAVFQFIKEQNPQIDPSLYKKVQDVVEAGRNGFEADQKMLIDKKREYDNYRMGFPNNVLAGFMGFPKIDLDKFRIVTSDETEGVFERKKSEPIKLR